mgnify:CR=1 FL=1
MTINYPASRYSLDVQAEIAAMLLEGHSPFRIEKMLKERDGQGPTDETIRKIRDRLGLARTIREQSEEIVLRSGKIIHKMYDYLDDLPPGPELLKHAISVNAFRGTNQDKLDRSASPGGTTVNVVLVEAQRQAAPIEAEPRSQIEHEVRTGIELSAPYHEVNPPVPEDGTANEG